MKALSSNSVGVMMEGICFLYRMTANSLSGDIHLQVLLGAELQATSVAMLLQGTYTSLFHAYGP